MKTVLHDFICKSMLGTSYALFIQINNTYLRSQRNNIHYRKIAPLVWGYSYCHLLVNQLFQPQPNTRAGCISQYSYRSIRFEDSHNSCDILPCYRNHR